MRVIVPAADMKGPCFRALERAGQKAAKQEWRGWRWQVRLAEIACMPGAGGIHKLLREPSFHSPFTRLLS